jgi:hypothetical protein
VVRTLRYSPYSAKVFALQREKTEIVSQKTRSETVYGIPSIHGASGNPGAWLGLSRGQWFGKLPQSCRLFASYAWLATSLLPFASVLVETTPLCFGLFGLRLWRDAVFSSNSSNTRWA